MRLPIVVFASLLRIALPTESGAQASPVARVSITESGRASNHTRSASVTRPLRSTARPGSPSSVALRSWLTAFNSGDSARLGAYARRFEPDVVVTDEIGFREQTGGFDLVGIMRREPRHVEFLVRERKGPMTAFGVIDVSAAAQHRVTGRRFQPLGPNVHAADLHIGAAVRSSTLAAANAMLDTFYVLPDVAQRVTDTLRAREARGAYRRFENGVMFAMQLDDELAALTRDKHLHLMYSVPPLPPDSPANAGATLPMHSPDDARREQLRLNARRCGFDKVDVLSGNVGYVKLDMFADPAFCEVAASVAMTAVAATRALIFDLRDNGGGEPAMVSLVASYLFDRRTHLNDLWTRRTGTTEEFWTRDSVSGVRFGGVKPIVVLTSSRTFSGGEEFVYDLLQLKRVTVIGETTGGGAHPMASHRIGEHFMLTVPFARPVNPVTHTNWEGVGVAPHVTVPADDALRAALQQIGRDR